MTSPLIVFLAEDNPGDVFLVRRALREHGLHCHLIVAENGDKVNQFIERVGTTGPTPDVILLDLNLPRVEGPELFRTVRSNPACANVPLIVITSSDSPRDHAWTSEYRVSHYFRKPSTLDEFLKLGAVIRNLITESETQDLEGPLPAARP
jgi:CheY-like chemotaxis protein